MSLGTNDAARAASDYFNSLPRDERLKLAPLLEEYRRMGMDEAARAVDSMRRGMGERMRSIERSQQETADVDLVEKLETARADLHQVHLNYHHMVDVAQRYRQALEFARDFKPISYASETAALRMYVEEVRRRATDALESPVHDQIHAKTED